VFKDRNLLKLDYKNLSAKVYFSQHSPT